MTIGFKGEYTYSMPARPASRSEVSQTAKQKAYTLTTAGCNAGREIRRVGLPASKDLTGLIDRHATRCTLGIVAAGMESRCGRQVPHKSDFATTCSGVRYGEHHGDPGGALESPPHAIVCEKP